MPLLFPYQDKDSRIHRSLLKYTVYVAAFLFLFSILFSQGSTVIFTIWIIQVTQESILFATSMSLRLFLAIVAFSVLTFTVHPDDLLKILSRFGVKSMTVLSIATRMYPTIAADSGNIEDAMKARGVEFDKGNFIAKAKARAPVMMPLLLNSMDRSMEVAEAMEARGFGARRRTSYYDPVISRREKAIMYLALAAVPFGLAMFILGYGNANYLGGSTLTVSSMDVLVVALEVLLFTPILLGAKK
jgi:energy-coupling factor transport system permease protein